MAGEQTHCNQVEQFILLAKNAKGPALISLINQVLEAPGVYVFGELLQLPCIQKLSEGPNDGYSQLLNMFAYGTYHDYKALKSSLPPLSEAQKNKLRQLTIVSLAANTQMIPYSVLLRDLEVASVRELEDLVIEAVYAEVIQGKLDQVRQQLEVDGCIGRDLPVEGAAYIADTLQQWCCSCESISDSIEKEVVRVSQCRKNHLQALQQIQTEIGDIRRLIQANPSTSIQTMESIVEQEGEGAKVGSSLGAEQRRQPSLDMFSKGKNPVPPRN
ncbi:COP9 signalosome complex subunit 7b-like [Osmerus mordax]|uniref:COP9 signalosome complex subunit 7b-like n=1 Tax=Osmerus mordax TaxID=8014 RepID=UPI003510C453